MDGTVDGLKDVGTNSLAVARIIPNGLVSTKVDETASVELGSDIVLLPGTKPGGATA